MHPSRTILTSLGIVWGMFILVLLTGVGKGFERGVYHLFSGFSKGATYVYSSETSMGYGSTSLGVPIRFNENDLMVLKEAIPQITDISPEVSEWRMSYHDDNYGSFEIRGVYPDYFNIRLLDVSDGRLLNPLDNYQTRNTAVIGENVADVLFKKRNPVGETMRIENELYRDCRLMFSI